MGQRKIWVPARFLGVSGSQAEDETRKGSSSTTKQGLARDLFLLDFWDVTLAPLLFPSVLSQWGEIRIKVGWEYPTRCTRDCTRRFVPLLLLFSFSQSEIGFASPYRSSPFIVDPPEGRGCCCAFQATATTFVIKPPYRCRRLFRQWRHSPPVFVKQALDPPPRLQPFSHGYRRRCS